MYEGVQIHVEADALEEPKHSALPTTVAPLPEQTLLNLTAICLMCVKTACRNRNWSEQKTTPTNKQKLVRKMAQVVTILSVWDSDECAPVHALASRIYRSFNLESKLKTLR